MKVRHVRRVRRAESKEGIRRVGATLKVGVTADVQSVHRLQHRLQGRDGQLALQSEARQVKVGKLARRVAHRTPHVAEVCPFLPFLLPRRTPDEWIIRFGSSRRGAPRARGRPARGIATLVVHELHRRLLRSCVIDFRALQIQLELPRRTPAVAFAPNRPSPHANLIRTTRVSSLVVPRYVHHIIAHRMV